MPHINLSIHPQPNTDRNVINVLRQQQAQSHRNHDNNSSSFTSWFKPSNFAKRLNDTVTFAYIVDAVAYIIAVASDDANEVISNGAPAIVNGLICIVPAIIPFLPNLIGLCQHNLNQGDAELEEYIKELDELYPSELARLEDLEMGQENRARRKLEITNKKNQLIAKFKVKLENYIREVDDLFASQLGSLEDPEVGQENRARIQVEIANKKNQLIDKFKAEIDDYIKDVDDLYVSQLALLDDLEMSQENQARHQRKIADKKKELIAKFKADKATGKLENIINTIYLAIRGVGGVLIMIKACQAGDDDRDAELANIGKWMQLGSTAAYLIYYAVCLLPKRLIKKCCPAAKTETESENNTEAEASPIAEEKKEESKESEELPSVIISQTLFSTNSSPRSSLPVPDQSSEKSVVSNLASLTEPLLKSII